MRRSDARTAVDLLVDTIRGEIDRIRTALGSQDRDVAGGHREREAAERAPEVTVGADDETYVVTVALPEYEPGDVTARLEDRTLVVEGERFVDESVSTDAEAGRDVRRERRRESTRQEVAFPESVRADAVTAEFRDGVLTVTVPKAKPADWSHTDVE